MSNGVPILLVVLLAKWVGDLLNDVRPPYNPVPFDPINIIFHKGLYETLIEIRRIPVLGPTPPAGMKAARASGKSKRNRKSKRKRKRKRKQEKRENRKVATVFPKHVSSSTLRILNLSLFSSLLLGQR